MIAATSVSIFYSDSEDRIFLDASAGEGGGRLILTRRITRRLLRAFVTLLEKSSVAMKRAPADLRFEAIALEHLSAVHAPKTTAAAAVRAATPATAFASILVGKVDVQVTRVNFRLIFFSAQEPVMALTVTRQEFHRLLGGLDRFAVAAEWNIRDGAEWLDTSTANVTAGRLVS